MSPTAGSAERRMAAPVSSPTRRAATRACSGAAVGGAFAMSRPASAGGGGAAPTTIGGGSRLRRPHGRERQPGYPQARVANRPGPPGGQGRRRSGRGNDQQKHG